MHGDLSVEKRRLSEWVAVAAKLTRTCA